MRTSIQILILCSRSSLIAIVVRWVVFPIHTTLAKMWFGIASQSCPRFSTLLGVALCQFSCVFHLYHVHWRLIHLAGLTLLVTTIVTLVATVTTVTAVIVTLITSYAVDVGSSNTGANLIYKSVELILPLMWIIEVTVSAACVCRGN